MIPRNDYFQGVLQLRNPNNKVIEFIKKFLEQNNTYITKTKKVKNGWDYWVTSQRVLQNLGNKLKSRFDGILKVNPRIYTRDWLTSKDVYRVNVYFELCKARTGQIIDFRGDKVKITAIGKKIFAKDLKTGKKVCVDIKEIR